MIKPLSLFNRAHASALLLAGLVFLTSPGGPVAAAAEAAAAANRWWSDAVEKALVTAGTNRAEIAKALGGASESQREGLQFLIENMPEPDLQSLSASFLLENLELTYEMFAKAPWRDQIPKEVFLNDILPYASVNEKRDAWRRKLRDICAPLITDCRTPTEVVQRLNRKLFPLLKVGYNTGRKKPDQSPIETMESGKATCTGLSILLVDACRSVGVPARVVGTPLWVNMRGNHTWMEIWDGDWHFTGAAEPAGALDQGWFNHDASQARKDDPKHSIYASSFKKTGLSFPMIWARDVTYVSAVNVTDRYTPKAPAVDPAKTRLLVKVLDRPAGQRVIAPVVVTEGTNGASKLTGTSRGETADLNDILPFQVPRQRTYEVRAELGGRSVRKEVQIGTNAQELVILCLDDMPIAKLPSQMCYAPPTVRETLKPTDAAQLNKAVAGYFAATPARQEGWKFSGRLEKLLRNDEAAVREAVWKAYQNAPIHQSTRQDYDGHLVRSGKDVSPYTVKTVGTRPRNGWALFIAMHGGGGVPKEVNDSQWEVMQRYYRDHPEAGGYLYVALRAPNNVWNGFYDTYVYPLVGNLVRQFLLLGDVDPNKVFIMGYSHGGYGAFAIGPKMPDRFAAVHASAAAPTDGDAYGKNLRNTIFTYMIGEKDTDHGRIERCRKFDEAIKKFRADRPDSYPVVMQLIEGNGHRGLPDRDKIKEMYPAVRNPVPAQLTWLTTDPIIRDFYWLQIAAPVSGGEIGAVCKDNQVTLTANARTANVRVLLDSRLVDCKRPVLVTANGRTTKHRVRPSLRTLCETLLRRGDPELAFTASLDVALESGGATPGLRAAAAR